MKTAGDGEKRSRAGRQKPAAAPTVSLGELLAQLIQALGEQTAALNRMAKSNEDLVQALIQNEGDEDAEPSNYLSGQPINPRQ